MNYGRYQLKELVVRYCDWGGSSRGVREFIAKDLVRFAEANPQLKINVLRGNNMHPVLRGRYINGRERVVDVKNIKSREVKEFAIRMRNQSGRKVKKFSKPVITERPSIQGYWQGRISYDPTATYYIRNEKANSAPEGENEDPFAQLGANAADANNTNPSSSVSDS